MNVDEHLSALFSGMDTREGFYERLMDRLADEVAAEGLRADEARRQEQLRHRIAQQNLRPWQQAARRWVTLETVGIAVLAAVTVTSVWSTEQIKQVVPVTATVLGLLLAMAPVLAPMIRNRRP